jgi:hypothetical protein
MIVMQDGFMSEHSTAGLGLWALWELRARKSAGIIIIFIAI